MHDYFVSADSRAIRWMRTHSVDFLRIGLGIVFVWFGALKVFDVSPVVYLIEKTYSFFPIESFMLVLGIWEIIVGIGLIFSIYMRLTLFLFWAQMLGTVAAPFLYPELFFSNGNPLLLTTEGEFVIKNLVLITAGMVIGGHQLKEHDA